MCIERHCCMFQTWWVHLLTLEERAATDRDRVRSLTAQRLWESYKLAAFSQRRASLNSGSKKQYWRSWWESDNERDIGRWKLRLDCHLDYHPINPAPKFRSKHVYHQTIRASLKWPFKRVAPLSIRGWLISCHVYFIVNHNYLYNCLNYNGISKV